MFAIRQSIVFVLIGFACLFAWTHGRSVSVIGDINIDVSDDKFICDKIECPANTDRCVVSKEKDTKNSTVLVRSNTCYSATNEVLKNSVTNETVDPNARIQVHIVANRNGLISSVINSYGWTTSNKFDAEKFNKEMAEFQNNLQQELEDVNRELSNLGLELGNLFG